MEPQSYSMKLDSKKNGAMAGHVGGEGQSDVGQPGRRACFHAADG